MVLQQNIEQATVRILDKTGATIGAGFIVADKLVVTCAHVIEETGSKVGKPIRIKFYNTDQKHTANVLRNFWSKDNEDDIAFLEINDPPKILFQVPMGSSQNRIGHSFCALGFPIMQDREAYLAQGKIAAVIPIIGNRRDILQLDGEQIKKGLSGAAVWDLDDQVVVGMITEFIDDGNTRVGYATTTESLKKICPQIDINMSVIDTSSINNYINLPKDLYENMYTRMEANKNILAYLEISDLQTGIETKLNEISFIRHSDQSINIKGKLFTLLYPIPAKDNIPLQPAYFAPRKRLISDLEKKIASTTWLALVDGPGKGKTQIALSLANSNNIKSVWWISLKGVRDDSRQHLLNQLTRWLIEITQNENWWGLYWDGQLELGQIIQAISSSLKSDGLLIIDNLPDAVDNQSLFDDISLIAKGFSSTNTKLITSSQRDIPPSVMTDVGSRILTSEIPYFSKDDTYDVLKSAGAPERFLKDNIVSLIRATGKGHPILIAATIIWLKRRNWQRTNEEIDALLTGIPVKETLDYSRRDLLRIIDNDPKELLFRLSLLWESFDKNLAIEIANIRPRINNPGECLDELAGVYLDRLSEGKYSLAPLLTKAGEDNLSEDIQRKIHKIVADKHLSSKVIKISDAQNGLIHLWAAQDYQNFGFVLIQLLLSTKTREHAKQIDWATFLVFGIKWPDEIDLNMRIMIRAAQVRTAVLAGGKYLELNNDLDQLIAQAGPENIHALIFAYGNAGVMCRELPLAIALPRYIKLYLLLRSNMQLFIEMYPSIIITEMPDMVWSLALDVKTLDEISYFVGQVLSLTIEEIQGLINSTICIEASSHMLDQSWLFESTKTIDKRNWENVLSFINKIELNVNINYLPPLRIACARAKAIVYADYFQQYDVALSVLTSILTLDDQDLSFLINYTAGCISSDGQSFDDAISFFEKAEKSIGECFKYYRLDAKRKLAILYSRQEKWDGAKNLCVQVIHQFRKDYPQLKYDGLEMMGELAWVHWASGNRKKSCAALYGYLRGLLKYCDQDDFVFAKHSISLGMH